MTTTLSRPGPAVHVPAGGKPIKSWANAPEAGAVQQAENLARLPFVISHVALMPDAHQGYGMPIGGVLFADKAVVPYAIGVDIGCGVVLGQTDLSVDDLPSERLDAILSRILATVPVGNGPRGALRAEVDADELLEAMGYLEVPPSVQWVWWSGAIQQAGTLGGGNHFIELQADEDGRVYVMLHSGSRSLGKKICDHYAGEALRLNQRWHSQLPDKELAFLPVGASEFDAYWEAMEFALRFAEQNRDRMLGMVRIALAEHAGSDVSVVVDCHHNYAAWENHRGQNGIVHRKGAVRARLGEDVLIPGSMGTASYWARGLGATESFMTCQHGAGRAMSRGAARKAYGGVDEMQAELDAAGTRVYTPDPAEVLDEAPRAYKDIEDVMSRSADLVEVVHRLRPLGTVKG